MGNLRKSLLDEITHAMRLYEQYSALNSYTLPSKQQRAAAFVAAALAAISRATGQSSTYFQYAQRYADSYLELDDAESFPTRRAIDNIMGTLQAVHSAIILDYLHTARELIHGEVFADFLDMAKHLQEAGYKDAAAVVAGGVLEQRVRHLCVKHSIQVEVPDTNGKLRPRSTEALNVELAKIGAYDRGTQKRVTAWLDLRNKAAHGHYAEYTAEDVALFVGEIRLFTTQYPA